MKTSAAVAISVGTVATGVLGMCATRPLDELLLLFPLPYAAYFDYRRRNDPEFRKSLKRESRRQARIAKEAAEQEGKAQKEEIRRTVQEAIDEGFPTDLEERESFFMESIAKGEALAGDGSDPVGAALCFYKGLKVYPEPNSLISIYDNTVPKDVLEILAVMVSQDKSLKVGSFGADKDGSGSDSGHGLIPSAKQRDFPVPAFASSSLPTPLLLTVAAMAACPAKGLHFLHLPCEVRLLVYKQLFHAFTLELHHGGSLVPYDCHPDRAAHQICRTNKQIRQESIPILAASLKLICSPTLLSRFKGPAVSSSGPSPQLVTPKLSPAFRAHIQGLSLSLESAYIPDFAQFPRLQKIVVDAWYVEPAVRRKKTDTDAELVRMARLQMDDTWEAAALYPAWLKDVYGAMPHNVALAVQLVWELEADDPSKTHLKALIDLREAKIAHREEGGQILEYCDTVPPQWLYD
ncbi:hypothetical protein DV737_g615, partial [Chaetothyriales sp. CBS 132003]